MSNFNRFLNNNVLNSFQRNLFQISSNLNPQQIQSAANSLWDSANQYVLNNIPFGYSYLRESVTLLVDISAEDRLFLEHEAKIELSTILGSKRCKIDLNVPSSHLDNMQAMDSCQVQITGPPVGVCETYLYIRQLLPITVWFDLKLNSSLRSIVLDPNAQPLLDMQKKYEIAICVIPIQSCVVQPTPSNNIAIYIRTNRRNEEKLKIGIEDLTHFIESNKFGDIYPKIQTKIDVPANQPTIIGRSYSLLDPIAAKTSTQISVQRSATNLMSNLSITGLNYSSICSARNEISDRFVVELNFSVIGDQVRILENFGRQLERMSEEFGVHILMKPSAAPTNRTMIIRGTDKEVNKLFEVRLHIIDLLENPVAATPIPMANGTAFVH